MLTKLIIHVFSLFGAMLRPDPSQDCLWIDDSLKPAHDAMVSVSLPVGGPSQSGDLER